MNHSALDSDSDSDEYDYDYEEELVVMEFPVSSMGREQQEPRQEHLSVIVGGELDGWT